MSFLGGLGEGLSSAASTYMQQKHDVEEQKRQQKQVSMQGLQLLLGQNDLPMDTYVHAIGQLGELSGDPTTKQVYQTLVGQMQQQNEQRVPLGPEQETLASQVARLKGGMSNDTDASYGLSPSPLPDVATAPSMMRVGDVPRDVYHASLMAPIQEAAAKARMKPTTVRLPTGQWALQDAAGNIVKIMEGAPANAAIASDRNAAAMDRLKAHVAATGGFITERAQLRARADVDKVLAANPGMTPDAAAGIVAQKMQSEESLRQARIAQTRAQTIAIPERVAQGWKALSDRDLEVAIRGRLADNTIANTQLRGQVEPLIGDLKTTRDQIEYLEKINAQNGKLTDEQRAQLSQLQMDEVGLMNNIWGMTNATVGRPGIKPPPGQSGGGGRSLQGAIDAFTRKVGRQPTDEEVARMKAKLGL